jgi:dihydropteroate synthase
MQLNCGGKFLDLSRPIVMGILNVTPDSFSDGGYFVQLDAATAQGKRMATEGAAIIDVGGESTRPKAVTVSVAEELHRVIPVITALATKLAIPISIDTTKPEVMQAAIKAGASFINDTNALRADGAVEMAKFLNVPVCLMHKQGEPSTMQQQPQYQNVVVEVQQFLRDRVAVCQAAGIARNRLVIDPGFGFGKTFAHNLTLFRHLNSFKQLDVPLMVGISRKSMLGAITNKSVEQRLPASLAAAILAIQAGANILRVHDVAETVDAIKIVETLSLHTLE